MNLAVFDIDGIPTRPYGGEIPGAAAFLAAVRAAQDWSVAIATGNFQSMAELKLARGKIPWQGVPIATADDSISRADLIRIATSRASEQYGIGAFSRMATPHSSL